MDSLIATLDEYLVQKSPVTLPDSVREFLVKVGPWIALVLLVLTLPVVLLALGLGAFLAPFLGVGYATGFGVVTLLSLVQIGLLVLALPGLFARKRSAWMLLFYQQLVGAVGSLWQGAVVGMLLGLLIGLFFLFQVRSKYVN